MCTEVCPPMILTREIKRVLIRFKQDYFSPQYLEFSMHIVRVVTHNPPRVVTPISPCGRSLINKKVLTFVVD